LAVPGLLYTMQHNLLFVALMHLSAATYSTTYQLKVPVTAIFCVLFLEKPIRWYQWIALVVLMFGAALVQMPTSTSNDEVDFGRSGRGNSWIGLTAILGACMLSGACNVYMEKLLKQNRHSLFVRNLQLSLLGALSAFACSLWHDGQAIQENGVLQGFDAVVWLSIGINSLGGLATAAVLFYLDNIVKCFAQAAAIVCICFVSFLVDESAPSAKFLLGMSLVTSASILYGLGPDVFFVLCRPRIIAVLFIVAFVAIRVLVFVLAWPRREAGHVFLDAQVSPVQFIREFNRTAEA